MLNQSKDKEHIKTLFMRAVEGFSTVAAVAVTFFLTPILNELSHPFVRAFTLNHYPRELLVPVEFAWFFIIGGLAFFATRASLSLLLIGVGLILFMRFFA